MHRGFVKLNRSDETFELLGDPNAFTLLGVIALRARRTATFNVHNLQPGQALIGDYQRYGMSRQQYRSAMQRLRHWGLADFKPTSKGTIATLRDARVYDVNVEPEQPSPHHPATNDQPTANHRATTNKNGKNGKKEKNTHSGPVDSRSVPAYAGTSGNDKANMLDITRSLYAVDSRVRGNDKRGRAVSWRTTVQGDSCGVRACSGPATARASGQEQRVCDVLLDCLRQRKPDVRPPQRDAWIEQVRAMIDEDGRDPTRIEAVIRWSQRHPFWHSRIVHPAALRRHFDTLELQMAQHQPPTETTAERLARLRQEEQP
jgi:hypothetical protein